MRLPHELAGLPASRMGWNSSDAPQALKKFKTLCELHFSGQLEKKDEQVRADQLPADLVRRRRDRVGLPVGTYRR